MTSKPLRLILTYQMNYSIHSPNRMILWRSKSGIIKKRLSFEVGTIVYNTTFEPSLLRLFWKAVLEVNHQVVLSLPDRDLSQLITQKVKDRVFLNDRESQELDNYVTSKLVLIRDLVCVA
jgi:hypothetical protein